MQNTSATLKFSSSSPSLRPEIEIHSLDYDFPEPAARPVVRAGQDAGPCPAQPAKPACAQTATPSPNVTSSPSYKPAPFPFAQRPGQGNVVASKSISPLTTKLDACSFSKAIQDGCCDSVKQHIKARLPLDKGPTENSLTPLMLAASLGHEAIVKLLLQSGAKVSQRLSNDMTALLYAARNGHTTVVEQLLSKGAKLNEANSDGTTPLMFAALKGDFSLVHLLLSKRAEVNVSRTDGMTALEFARQYDFTAIKEALEKAGAVEQRS